MHWTRKVRSRSLRVWFIFYLQFVSLELTHARLRIPSRKIKCWLIGHSQNHLAVAGGCAAFSESVYDVPTRYREVVLTVSNLGPCSCRIQTVIRSHSVQSQNKTFLYPLS